MQRVAILGLGIMGGGMAANWLAKGFEVSVWNRTAAKAAAAGWQGRQGRGDPSRGRDRRRLHLRHGGGRRRLALRLARRGWRARRSEERRDRRRIEHVDPRLDPRAWRVRLRPRASAFSMRRSAAAVRRRRRGELRFFVGGDPQTYEAARPALAAVGSKMDLLGPVGAGATWKLINNQLAAGQIAALAEALAVAKKAGFKDEQISELILGGAAASPIVKLKLPRMLARGFRADGFRAQSHAEGRSLCGGARSIAGRAGRHDRGRGEGVRARGRQGARRQGHGCGRRLTAASSSEPDDAPAFWQPTNEARNGRCKI